MRTRSAGIVTMLMFAGCMAAAPALAQDPDPAEFTPVGYEFCGWKDYEYGGYVLEWEERLSGAGLTLFARDMTCTAAKRNERRVRFTKSYRPKRTGYKCAVLETGTEYIDYRCSKKGQPRVSFRVKTGA